METYCDSSFGDPYKSKSQKARVITEAWAARHLYCLSCDSRTVTQTKANTRARDFLCPVCDHPYELKGGCRSLVLKVRDGAYETMIQRIENSEAPTLLLLRYDLAWSICDLFAIHRYFLTTNVITSSAPLRQDAKRAGWVGCNILTGQVPTEGKIHIIRSGTALDAVSVREQFRRAERLKVLTPKERGWTALTLRLLRTLGKSEFTLAEAYRVEEAFAQKYPGNRHVRAKIRQQLQLLRDMGFIEFVSRGCYRLAAVTGV